MNKFKGISSAPWDEVQFFSKKFSDQQVRFIIYLNGRLDEKILELAVEASTRIAPILCCRFQEKYFRPFWQPVPTLSIDKIFYFLETLTPDEEIQKSLIREINPLTGPIFRVDLIRSQTDTICINLDHTAGDASSVTFYAYLLTSLYKSLQKNPSFSPEPNLRLLRKFRLMPANLKFKEKVRLVLQSYSRSKIVMSWQFPWKKGELSRSKRILMHQLRNEKSSALLQYAASTHSWPTDVILAAYFRALHSVISPDENTSLSIRVPVNMRAYKSAGERGQIANLSSSFDATIPRIGTDFSDTLTLVAREMEQKRKKFPGMALILKMIPLLELLPYKFVKKAFSGGKIKIPSTPPWLIQMGTIQPCKLDFGEIHATSAFPLQSVGRAPGVFQLGVSRFENIFTFIVCFFGDDDEMKLVTHFLDLFENELPG